MTREEAIESLRHCASEDKCPDGIVGNCYGCNRRIALNMAIEALSAEPKDILKSIPTVELLEELGVASVEELMEEPLSHEEAWAEIESDLISRADAVKAWEELSVRGRTEFDQVLMTLPSAEAVHGWIPFTRRPMTEEEQKDYPNCTFIFDCVLPDDGDEILVSNGRFVWMDAFCNDIDGCYLDGGDDIDEDMAWMPLPTPYKGGDE